ncbi:hypothetical protein [Alloiococcus otitis]|uniref:hypothetical protein n=1 Tax=Alloiococcus otitis TaxID=1652 RepID=UPI000590DBA1|nr:hypothetical protein [Alloiococcus otitis]
MLDDIEQYLSNNEDSNINLLIDEEKDSLIDTVKEIIQKMSLYYSNVFADNPENILKFNISDYNDNPMSLVYGYPGIALTLKSLNIIDEFQLRNISIFLQKYYKINKSKIFLNNGLMFGKAGLALFHTKAGSFFSNNIFLFELIETLNNSEYREIDFANGLTGITYALKLISDDNTYPNFSKIIESYFDIISAVDKPIGKYQGLQYGNIGISFGIQYFDDLNTKSNRLDSFFKNIDIDVSSVSDDKIFTGLSYSYENWPHIRSPYLYSGGASLLYVLTTYFHNSKNCDWQLLRTLLKTLEVPTTHTYGIGYGMSGVALIIMMILILPNVPLDVRQRLELLLMDKIEYIIIHFHDNKDFKGFYDEKQDKFIDDFGNGTLGILKILKMFLKYNDKELCWDEDVFSLIPLPNII